MIKCQNEDRTSYASRLSQRSFFNVNKMRDIKDIPAPELKFIYGCVFDSLLLYFLVAETQYPSRALRSLVRYCFLSLEHKIHIFWPPCNVFYISE